MFTRNETTRLQHYLDIYTGLSPTEKELLETTLTHIDQKNSTPQKELLTLVQTLRTRSLAGELSNDGKKLLQKLQQNSWYKGLLDQAFFLH